MNFKLVFLSQEPTKAFYLEQFFLKGIETPDSIKAIISLIHSIVFRYPARQSKLIPFKFKIAGFQAAFAAFNNT